MSQFNLPKKQPIVRVANPRNPEDMSGLAYVPKLYSYNVMAPVGGAEDILLLETADPIWIRQVWLRVIALLDGTTPTCEVGLDDNVDAFIDTADYVETTIDTFATNLGSINADFPNGVFLPAGDQIVAGFAAADMTVREVQIIMSVLHVDDMYDYPHFSF